jgi:cell division protein FtsZ
MGMAMMGSAVASGEGRARIAAEMAVNSPLLETVDLKGARGVLVNISADDSLTLAEYAEVMGTIQSFTTEEATVIVGTVLDASMGDSLRVTMVATGLVNQIAPSMAKPKIHVVHPVMTGTDSGALFADVMPMGHSEGSVIGRNPNRAPAVVNTMLTATPMESYIDIPPFLRRQAD